MAEQFINPITLSFSLLDAYKNLLRETLQLYKLAEPDIEAILKTIQVDRGLYFSINRKYQASNTSFVQFCRDTNLSLSLAERFLKLERLHLHQESAIRAILDDTHMNDALFIWQSDARVRSHV